MISKLFGTHQLTDRFARCETVCLTVPLCFCLCVFVCVCARARARVCVCVARQSGATTYSFKFTFDPADYTGFPRCFTVKRTRYQQLHRHELEQLYRLHSVNQSLDLDTRRAPIILIRRLVQWNRIAASETLSHESCGPTELQVSLSLSLSRARARALCLCLLL